MDRSTSESPSLLSGPSPNRGNSTPVKPRNSSFTDANQSHPNGDSTPNTPGTSSPSGATVGRKESYKMQRKNYRFEKKRAAKELLSTLKDPTVIVLSDWLKVRGTLKSWTKVWCVLKPGLLLLYKSDKLKDWVGTILLSMCKLIERPSKKDGFCFKLFHPLDQSIWAPKGPQGETIPAPIQPLPTSHLIFRVSSQGAGKCWMDALELALKCSSLLMRSMSTRSTNSVGIEQSSLPGGSVLPTTPTQIIDQTWNESDNEKHDGRIAIPSVSITYPYSEEPETPVHSAQLTPRSVNSSRSASPISHKLHRFLQTHWSPMMGNSSDYDDTSQMEENEALEAERRSRSTLDPLDFASRLGHSQIAGEKSGFAKAHHSDSESDDDDDEDCSALGDQFQQETNYVEQTEEEFGSAGEQTEELADENKSLIWFLVKQVRPGMDLSKVVLPTFILEPRSFLDKLSDYYYHADVLSKAVLEDDPFNRIKTVVQWYLSGFYKKPKGLKKPYNPILGEVFRCCWRHPNGSTTFYIAEQVSHHPPKSAFYVTNRQDGFTLSGTILAKSKFYGNSLSAVLEGSACLTLLPRGEDYVITMPYAHCKGILLGTLTMELGGDVCLKCEKTGYRADLEFKLRPLLGGADSMNYVTGKIRLGKETLATICGYWDDCIQIEDKRTNERQILWHSTPDVRAQRLKRCTVPLDEQLDFESEKLWVKVSAAIRQENQDRFRVSVHALLLEKLTKRCDKVIESLRNFPIGSCTVLPPKLGLIEFFQECSDLGTRERTEDDLATAEKTSLEEAQRAASRERAACNETWIPRCFEMDPVTESWQYRHADVRPWDLRNDLVQFENNFIIATRTRHRTPMIRASSIVSVERSLPVIGGSSVTDSSHRNRMRTVRDLKNSGSIPSSGSAPDFRHSNPSESTLRRNGEGSISSSAEGDHLPSSEEDSRQLLQSNRSFQINWVNVLEHLQESHRETQEKLTKIHNSLQSIIIQQQQQLRKQKTGSKSWDLYLLALILALCQIVFWLCWRES